MAKLPKPSLDLNRLRRDATKGHAERQIAGRAGSFAAIQAALPEIRALRADGIRWAAIAEALAAQGIIQGAGEATKPITTTRLTSIVSQLEKRQRRDEERRQARLGRTDLSVPADGGNAKPRQFRLAEELRVKTPGGSTDDSAADEEEIRRARYEAMRGLLKDDSEG